MKIDCSYIKEYNDYTCIIDSQDISPDADLEFIGNHSDSYNSDDVTKIIFDNCDMIKIPRGLKKFFKNLIKIKLQDTSLKILSKLDLIECKDIKEFHSKDNEIEFLPGDLFEGFKSLEKISFAEDNNLKFIEPTILDGLENLKYADFGPSYRSDPNTVLSKPNRVQKLLKGKVSAQPVEEWMKHPLSTEMLRRFYKQLYIKNLKLQVENLELKDLESKYKESIYVDLNTFIQDETTKDFKIIIENREFPVHKFLLAARSPTLAEILKNNPEVENLNLVDISVEIFDIILKFLYTDELPGDDGMNFLQLFAAAGKLKIEELKEFAARKIIEQINAENSLEILNLSNKYEHDELKLEAFNEIRAKYPKVDIKDKWIADGDKIEKLIKFFKKMEEAEKSLEHFMI